MKTPKQLTDITPEYLTKIFKANGCLLQGSVKSVNFTKNNFSISSTCGHFELEYSNNSKGEKLNKIFVKLGKNDGREVNFYKYLSENKINLDMFVECYFAEYDKDSDLSILILKDYSDFHSLFHNVELLNGETFSSAKNKEAFLVSFPVPNEKDYFQIVETLAEFHAFWWENNNISNAQENGFIANAQWSTEKDIRKWCEVQMKNFETHQKIWLPKGDNSRLKGIAENLFDIWGKYYKQRIEQKKNLTLTHGNSCSYHFLNLSDKQEKKTKIIDFKSICLSNPAKDLVCLNVKRINSAQRNLLDIEKRILKHYHETLQKKGVVNYSFEQLMIDYKVEVIFALFSTLPKCSDQDFGESFWWYEFQNIKHAFIDLNCAELYKK